MKFLIVFFALFTTGFASAQNINPTAVAGQDDVIMTTDRPYTYTFNGSASFDSDGEIVSYYWVYQNDTISNSMNVSFDLINNENTLVLKVVDNEGATDSDEIKVFLGDPTNFNKNRISIRNGSVTSFFSGMNIAWNRFARDLDVFDEPAREYFSEIMDSVSASGGNSLRWWLHTNGVSNPTINSEGKVTGIEDLTIQNMKQVLDLAYDYGIAISMCLWSFDMLQGQGQDTEAMKMLLQNKENIKSYIDNALIPILEKVGDHPAIMTWEIFNEPEGMTQQFGWSNSGRINMNDIQQFVNLCSGAIHRTVPGALVSNGSWNIRVMSDINGFRNYYSDEELISVGGDPDGYLDFYQVHYYPQHFNNSTSPFHRPASYWELNKPIVIGEFPADTIGGNAKPGFSVEEAYKIALNYGYAGVMSWSWTDDSSFETTGRGLKAVSNLIGDELALPNDSLIDRIPQATSAIKPLRILLESKIANYSDIDLRNHFNDVNDSTFLLYEIVSNSNNSIVIPSLTDSSNVNYELTQVNKGTSEIVFRATDSKGWFAESKSVVLSGSTEDAGNNLAYFKPLVTSSSVGNNFDIFLNDGNKATLWKSKIEYQPTVIIDLDSIVSANFVSIEWGNEYPTNYEIDYSTDSLNWKLLSSQIELFDRSFAKSFTEIDGRFIRIKSTNTFNSSIEIKELSIENIVSNSAPKLISQIPDLVRNPENTSSINNYIKFSEVFTDEEHPDYLEFSFENSNDSVVEPIFSIGGVGLSLLFEDKQPGESIITVFATDPFGSTTSTDFTVTQNFTVGIEDDIERSIELYPNPAKDLLFINSKNSESIKSIQIIDLGGKENLYLEIGRESVELDVSSLNEGMYIIKIITENHLTVKRFLKD